jgi:hypothetical protein
MHARLITLLALAALLSSTACGQSERKQVDAEPLASEVAPAAPRPPSSEANPEPEPERHDALPASFPHDIPIPAGLIAKFVQSEQAGSYVAVFTGDLEPETVYRFFIDRLVAEGWTIDKARGVGPELGLFASKGDRITSVISTRIDGQLHVELGVSGGS